MSVHPPPPTHPPTLHPCFHHQMLLVIIVCGFVFVNDLECLNSRPVTDGAACKWVYCLVCRPTPPPLLIHSVFHKRLGLTPRWGSSNVHYYNYRYSQCFACQVMESEEFMLLPVNQLVDIISSDELNVRSEEQVYQAVMSWIKYNIQERRQHLPTVRLMLLFFFLFSILCRF